MTDTVVDPREDLAFVMASNFVFSIKLLRILTTPKNPSVERVIVDRCVSPVDGCFQLSCKF